ncbi:epidermal growth factor receptor kinase substrate 8-like protein 1a isoform X2 [Betta splendens]|nr:epidermal growth factor receptor kinase substrate 8-like protein 1a isoform X2 [Betta splendens]
MSARPPSVTPRKHSGVRVMMTRGAQHPLDGASAHASSRKESGGGGGGSSPVDAQREVEILNHCFDDVERFMSRLQQTAEAQSVLNQRKKRSKKNKKKDGEDDLLTMKALPPPESEFVDIFQKIKYSLCLLPRLKPFISQPDAPELLHHIFTPLSLMVKTTGGPAFGASVISPAMTGGAVSLLQEHLTEPEKELWTSLGPNWTSPRSQLSVSAPSYAPVFLDGWQPRASDPTGRPLEDPIESQHRQDAAAATAALHSDEHDDPDGNEPQQNSELLYCCSYDFVARNSSELSVLQGETLEVIESSKRWWRCRNRFGQVGFVPSNMLEPLSAVTESERKNPVVRRDTKRTPSAYPAKYFSYAPTSPVGLNPMPQRPHSMVPTSTAMGENNNRVLIMNDELIEQINRKRGSQASGEAAVPLNYQSSPAEVTAWLTAKGISSSAIKTLGVLNGAQLFSLNKEELRMVTPDEGSRLYSQIMVQKSILEDAHKATELEAVMQKQKLKSDQMEQSKVF